MKIITWNCNMAFRKKANSIFKYDADILIVPECENLDRLDFTTHPKKPNSSFWYGDNPNKGLGVFSFGEFIIEPLDIHNAEFRYVIPLRIYNDNESYTVLAVWTQKPSTNEFYVVQIWDAINYYSELLDFDDVLIAGDFNSNSIWDKPKKSATHSNVVSYLKSKGILSSFHHFFDQNHGEEDQMTLFMQRKRDKGFHIDYCFASANLIEQLEIVEIGQYNEWTAHSDHSPLIVEFRTTKTPTIFR